VICNGLAPPLLVIGLMYRAYTTAAAAAAVVYARAATVLQPSVRFGGSSLVYTTPQSATAHGTDRTSGDCRAWPLCVTCRIVELHYVKRMDLFRDWSGHS